MIINTKQIDELQKFEISSFAIWDDDGLCSKTFLLDNISQLHGNVVFLGLNRSGNEPNKQIYPDNYKMYEFRNFHSENHQGDKCLQKIIQFNKLEKIIGSYITDFYYDIESSSVNIKEDKNNIIEATECFVKQLDILNNNSLTIICFGRKVFKHLLIGLNYTEKIDNIAPNIKHVSLFYEMKYNLNIYGVWHYTNRGYNNKEVIELEQQLNQINELLA